ncbi:choline transporter [Pseudoalteromonas luteoviolacea]|uniref:Choline transporter n=1 Tax=Pseudoalteromonas luteoviolacea TaxID=43657 RepID=A0A0C1Q303_9GAMM|nr:BCCT family transporter [Pseudoalteromonas luteoviolacea]KID54981.1 choline transporter [Pseudoalteromonas luteoviolacea]
MKKDNTSLNLPVFYSASAIVLALVIFAVISPSTASSLFSVTQSAITQNGSWFYVLTVAIILGLVVYLSMSRFGEIKLGPDHSDPDYSFSTWLAMLFAAGMGIGLMFFGVAEPVMHFVSPPSADTGSVEAIKEAMRITFFHWGFHAWAIYAIVAMILAYFSYRHKLPLTLRSALYPIIGDRIHGWMGHAVDVFAVVGTVFGVATSLGLGAAQVNSGLAYLFSFDVSVQNQVVIMITITALASISVATGLDKGIKILSQTNMILAVVLLALIFFIGPSVFLLQAYVQNIGDYLSDIVSTTFNLFAYEKKDWIGGWTIFYWGWWLAWAPFVGLFIARISKGRTIREFVIGVTCIPTAFTLLWMTIFGNSALAMIFEQGMTGISDMVSNNSAVALFVFLENFPLSEFLIGLSIIMIVVFFVTSCDSGAMVIDMLCSNGSNHTPLWQRLFWSIGVGVVAAALSLAGGLDALQTLTIVSALPFSVVLLVACYGLIRALRIDDAKRSTHTMPMTFDNQVNDEQTWQESLALLIATPAKGKVDKFILKEVKPALKKIRDEFESNQVEAEVKVNNVAVILTVHHGDEHDFIYGVYKSEALQPDFTQSDVTDSDSYFRAEVYLSEGGQNYDIMGWSESAIISDVLAQYQKHLHFLNVLRE